MSAARLLRSPLMLASMEFSSEECDLEVLSVGRPSMDVLS
jgi:hypothetical protein